MSREDVKIMMEPERLSGEATSEPALSRKYSPTTDKPARGSGALRTTSGP
jgi:hypothetical protein